MSEKTESNGTPFIRTLRKIRDDKSLVTYVLVGCLVTAHALSLPFAITVAKWLFLISLVIYIYTAVAKHANFEMPPYTGPRFQDLSPKKLIIAWAKRFEEKDSENTKS